MTTETSNAREWVWVPPYATEEMIEAGEASADERPAYVYAAMLAAAPPPAAARGDVRGLVDALVDAAYQDGMQELDVMSDETLSARSALEQALAAEGVHCDSCSGSGVVVTYVDPYERGDGSSPEQSPCPDCAEGVQAGEVEQRARYTTDPKGDGYILRDGLRMTADEIVAALSQQPEARGVVRHDLCDCPNGRAEHSPSCAALTGERNG